MDPRSLYLISLITGAFNTGHGDEVPFPSMEPSEVVSQA